MRIGIIGGGPAGTAAAIALASMAKTKESEVDLTMIERRPHNGGRSFSKDDPTLTLNTSAGVTSVEPDDPDGFVRFLRRYRSAHPAEFAPRPEAADYLRHTLGNVDEHYSRIRHVRATASGAGSTSDTSVSVRVPGRRLDFDALVVATGAPFRRLPVDEASCRPRSPYQLRSDDAPAPDATVVIVGSSLSAIDASVSLHAAGHRGPIFLLSRSGRLPAVRRSLLHDPAGRDLEADVAHRSATRETSELSQIRGALTDRVGGHARSALRGGTGLDGTDEFLRAHDESETGVTSWERLMMSTIDVLNRSWPTAGDRERSTFRRGFGAELNRFISAMSLDNARVVRSMVASGQLRLLAGSLDHRGVPRDRDGSEVTIGPEDRFIVNATGLAPPIDDPFVASLTRDQVVSVNDRGGVRADLRTGRAHARHPIYALGPVTRGNIYTTNFLYSSVRSAQVVARAVFGIPTTHLYLAS